MVGTRDRTLPNPPSLQQAKMDNQIPVTSHDLPGHLADVADEYDTGMDPYRVGWHRRHIHFGSYAPGETFPENRFRKLGADLKMHDRAVVKMVEDVIAPARITADSRVVDAGCGVGGTAFHLAETRGCRVTGLNISHGQLKTTRDEARSLGLDHLVDFQFSDCSSEICLPDCSVDVIVTIEAACHFANRARFLQECARVLRPNGRIVGQDWVVSGASSTQDYEDFIQPLCESWSMIGLESAASYTDKLIKAGLEVEEFEDFDDRVRPNIVIVDSTMNALQLAVFLRGYTDKTIMWIKRFQLLVRAWRAGHFQVHRFCARKPD